ncbi:MAG: mechanosensitive ion channel family protein [Candidatus Bathyarchaeia archaeon]
MILNDIFIEYPYLITIIWVLIILVVALILERALTRWLRKIIRQKEIPLDVANGIILTERIVVLVGAVMALLRVGGLPSETVISFSALGGAAVGFASTRTIGNLIAGLFLFVTRPFRVGDYIRIDNIEGVVQEITLNYAKILTISGNIVSISTQNILDKDIIDYRFMDGESELFRYGFELAFDHTLRIEEIEKILDAIATRYAEEMPRKPDYHSFRLTTFGKHYMFYIYVEQPQDIFKFYPQLLREITQTWEEAKAQIKK